jgi:hypothetical protein
MTTILPRRITVIRIVGPVLVLAGLTGGLAAEQPSRRALRPCPAIEKPVCARLAGRLKDYGNACEAENAGAKVIARGLCARHVDDQYAAAKIRTEADRSKTHRRPAPGWAHEPRVS